MESTPRSVARDPILVVAALAEELVPLRRRARARPETRVGATRVFRGSQGRESLLMAVTGVGPTRAERTLRELLDRVVVRAVIGIGVAGALSSGVPEGTILAAGEVRNEDGAVSGPSADWLRAALRAGSVRRAVLLSVRELASTRVRKAALFSSLPPGDAAAVDMESASWARAAAEKGTPYLVLRSVLDPADEEIPEVIGRCLDGDGGVSRGLVIREALRHPGLVPDLLSLSRRVRRGASNLATVVLDTLAVANLDTPSPGER